MAKEWTKDLKAGDKVYIDRGRYGTRKLDLTTVKKITPKGFVRAGDVLFRDGYYNIDSWSGWSLIRWTQELEDQLKAEAHFNYMAHSINAIDARTLTLEKVQKIYDIIKEE